MVHNTHQAIDSKEVVMFGDRRRRQRRRQEDAMNVLRGLFSLGELDHLSFSRWGSKEDQRIILRAHPAGAFIKHFSVELYDDGHQYGEVAKPLADKLEPFSRTELLVAATRLAKDARFEREEFEDTGVRLRGWTLRLKPESPIARIKVA